MERKELIKPVPEYASPQWRIKGAGGGDRPPQLRKWKGRYTDGALAYAAEGSDIAPEKKTTRHTKRSITLMSSAYPENIHYRAVNCLRNVEFNACVQKSLLSVVEARGEIVS